MPVVLANFEKEFEKDPSLKRDDLRILREWLDKQPHLPNIDDRRLLYFLHCSFSSIEKAKALIENHYTARAHAPELFLNRSVNDKVLKQQADLFCFALLPKAKPYQNETFFFRFVNSDGELFDYNAAIKGFDMAVSLFQAQEGVMDGHVLIMDSEGLSLSHVMKINLASTKKLAYYLQDCFPHRLKAVHIMNVSPMTEKLFVLVKPFIRKEYVDLIHFHSKMDTVYEHVSKDLLPLEYGGKSPSWKELHATFKTQMLDAQEFYDQQNQEYTDETKRVGKPKTTADIYGVEGTFKKLVID